MNMLAVESQSAIRMDQGEAVAVEASNTRAPHVRSFPAQRGGKWNAYIPEASGKNRGLGYTQTEQEAASAHDAEAQKVRSSNLRWQHRVQQLSCCIVEEHMKAVFCTLQVLGSKAVLNFPTARKPISAPAVRCEKAPSVGRWLQTCGAVTLFFFFFFTFSDWQWSAGPNYVTRAQAAMQRPAVNEEADG